MGRPRMAASAVYLFLMIRGFLQSRGLSMPGATTILENVNLVSYATRELILDRQIAFVLREG